LIYTIKASILGKAGIQTLELFIPLPEEIPGRQISLTCMRSAVQPILATGIIIFTGFLFGELARRVKLPKITGYIIAGLLLNPRVLHIVPKEFVGHTDLITNIALAFIAFSVGGSIFFPRLKNLGKGIIYITVFEAEFAFFAVAAGFIGLSPLLLRSESGSWLSLYIPLGILLGSLAAPTDPSATLAVVHQYNTKGQVTSTVLGVAAFDDVFGIINYSFSMVVAGVLILHRGFSFYSTLLIPLVSILGSLLLGAAFGFVFNFITRFLKKETEGVYIVVIIGLLAACFGVAQLVRVDQLLSTMAMGIVVVNLNRKKDLVFTILTRYTEELIFVLFFTISGMYLNFAVMAKTPFLILIFVILRAAGKMSGTLTGAHISNSHPQVKRYTSGGLLPQGGIVVGLALLIKQNPSFSHISDILLNVILGATVIHELFGPVLAKRSLRKAGEIGDH
jgi:Kef-type K+ transport system membrane component KefB